MFKVNDRNARTRCEICSKLTIKTPDRRFVPFCIMPGACINPFQWPIKFLNLLELLQSPIL